MSVWRVGTKVTQNLYKDDKPVAMCQTPLQAAEIADGMNALEAMKQHPCPACTRLATDPPLVPDH